MKIIFKNIVFFSFLFYFTQEALAQEEDTTEKVNKKVVDVSPSNMEKKESESTIAISKTQYYDQNIKCIILDVKYPTEVAEEGIKKYMKNSNYKQSLNPLAGINFKDVYLKKMPKDSSPYKYYNIRFRFETIGSGTALSNFMVVIITDVKNDIIDFNKYPLILESGKILVDDFYKYFITKFIPEREISLTEKSIQDTKKYKIQTITDSTKTISELKKKITSYQAELFALNNSLTTQTVIFKTSIIQQQQSIDTLNRRLDSLHRSLKKGRK